MRILIVTPWWPTTTAPASGRFVQREALALATAHDVQVLHLDWQRGEPLPGNQARFHHIPLHRARPGEYLRARRLVSMHAQQADIVHTHALTGLLPWLIGRPSPRPWVHSEHWSGIAAPETLSASERAVRRALLPRLAAPDAVVAESTRLAAAIAPHRRGQVDIVPCIVPPAIVAEPPEEPELRLLFIGGLIPRKDPLAAVASLVSLRERGVQARLTLVGDGPLRQEVERAAVAGGVGDRVRLTGALDDTEVSAELDRADLFLLPTLGDNFCVVTAEALTHGRPIVSGAATGAIDYASAAVSEFVTEQTGPAYAEAILRVVQKTRSMSAAAIAQTVDGRFAPDTVMAALSEIYRRVR